MTFLLTNSKPTDWRVDHTHTIPSSRPAGVTESPDWHFIHLSRFIGSQQGSVGSKARGALRQDDQATLVVYSNGSWTGQGRRCCLVSVLMSPVLRPRGSTFLEKDVVSSHGLSCPHTTVTPTHTPCWRLGPHCLLECTTSRGEMGCFMQNPCFLYTVVRVLLTCKTTNRVVMLPTNIISEQQR